MMMADKTIKKMAAGDARKIVAGMFGCSDPRKECNVEPKEKAGKISMAKARKIVENF